MTIAITGSTGAVGGMVARALADDLRNELRLVVRDPSRAPDYDTDVAGVHVRRPRCIGRRAWRAPTRSSWSPPRRPSIGATSTAPSSARRRAPGCATSSTRPSQEPTRTRPSPSAVTTTTPRPRSARAAWRGRSSATTSTPTCCPTSPMPPACIRGPAGDGRVAAVARADADVRRLRAGTPRDVPSTGPEALTLTEIAARAGAVLGRDLRFEDETVDEAYASRRAAYDAEQWQLDAWVSTYTAIADGSVAAVTDDVRAGHRPPGAHPRAVAHAVRWWT